jgi:hypothetical protein
MNENETASDGFVYAPAPAGVPQWLTVGLPEHWKDGETAVSANAGESTNDSVSATDDQLGSEEVIEGQTEAGEDELATAEENAEDQPSEEESSSRGIKRKFQRYTRERDEANARADRLEKELAEIKAAITGLKGESKPEQPQASVDEFVFEKPRPKLEEFESDEDHKEAVALWAYEKARAKEQFEARQNESSTRVATIYNTFFSNIGKLEQNMGIEPGGLLNAVKDPNFRISQDAAFALAESEAGAQIAHNILVSDKELEKFNNMSAAQQLVYIGKQEARIIKPKTGSSTKNGGSLNRVSKAQAPSPAIRGRNNSTAAVDGKRMTVAEFAERSFKNQREYEAFRKRMI